MGIQLQQPSSGGIHSGLMGSSGLDSIRYGMDEIDLGIQQMTVMAGGELISPEIYDRAIGQLNMLKAGIKDKKLIMDIDEKIARYGIVQNNLVKKIQREADSDGTDSDGIDITDYKKQLEAEMKNERKKIVEGNISEPESYINSMAGKNYEWAGNIMQEAFDYNKATGKNVNKLYELAQSVNEDGDFYNRLRLMDKSERSRYGIYLKTDTHGGIMDVTIKENDAKFPIVDNEKDGGWGGDYMEVDGDNSSGFSINLKQSDTTKEGRPTTNWNGKTLVINETGDKWNLPEGDTIDNNVSSSKNALILYRQPGEIIKTPDEKAYIFGGFDGKSEKWHYIPSQDITSRMNWWDNYTQRSDISYDTFDELSDIIGEPLMMDKLIESEESNIMERSAEMANYFRENPGFSPEMFDEALGEVPIFGKLYKGASKFIKRTNIDLSEEGLAPSYKKNNVEPIYMGKGRPSSPPAQKESTGEANLFEKTMRIFRGKYK